MAKLLVSDDLWAAIAPLLPPEPPKPKGGRPRLPDRAALTGILFVLKTGLPWEYLPAEMGCGSGMMLAQVARLARGRGLGRVAPGAAGAPAQRGADRLAPCRTGQCFCPGEKGGTATGPNPTDRGRPGSKRHIVVDARGTPLGVLIGPANQHDSQMLAPTLDAIPPVRSGRRGRPRRRPNKLHADKGYDHRRCRHECRTRGIRPRIARRGMESSQRLGRHRWVVERTHAWLNRLRRLTIRYERRADIHFAFTKLGCALICLGQIRRFC
jgi:transposase